MKTKISAFLSTVFALITGSCTSACGVACLASGCCGGYAILGFIGISGSAVAFLDKLTPVFLIITVLSLGFAFYKAYKPKPAPCCDTSSKNEEMSCCEPKKKTSLFSSKSFLWSVTVLVIIMWSFTLYKKMNDNSKSTTPNSEIEDSSCCPKQSCCEEDATVE
jgi:hypothetical protein